MSNYSSSQFNFSDQNSSWKMTFDKIPEGATILDIGCSSGNFGKELIEQKQCIVDGIEMNKDDARVASSVLRNVFVLNIETDPLPVKKYDIIFMGDVIEHLARPVDALNKLHDLLKTNGKIVFSIPNITHMLVRMMLLSGKIEYGKTGLLDETHLHFYNQAEIARVFNQSGYEIDDIDYVMRDIPVELLEEELKDMGLFVASHKKFTSLVQSVDAAAYQFVGTAKRSKDKTAKQQLPEKSPLNVNDKYLEKAKEGYTRKIRELEDRIQQLDDYHADYKKVVNSNSYRIGRKLTLPIRKTKTAKRIIGKKVMMRKNIKRVLKAIDDSYGLKVRSANQRPNTSIIVRSLEHPTSSTFIRLIAPMSVIAKKANLRIELLDGDHPKIAKTAKTIIIQRTALANEHIAQYVIETAAKNKAKIFVDTDDAFNQLDTSHPQYHLQKERVNALERIIHSADEVWFSTEALKQSYKLKKSKVISNTIDSRTWTKFQSKKVAIPRKDKLEILYMGTKTHDDDFRLIYPALEKLAETHPDSFRLHLVGVASTYNRSSWIVEHQPPDGLYPNFTKWLSDQGPFDIGITPLKDTSFNNNKSDIKVLDYLALGITPIVSDTLPYKNPELNNFVIRVKNTYNDWYETLNFAVENRTKNRKQRESIAKKAYMYLAKKRSIEQAADEILNSIKHE